MVSNFSSASALGERVLGHLPAHTHAHARTSFLGLASFPSTLLPSPPPLPPPHRGHTSQRRAAAPRFTEPSVPMFIRTNCLCRKMLVTRAERFRPVSADPAGGRSPIPPAKPRRNRLQGGGCATLRPATRRCSGFPVGGAAASARPAPAQASGCPSRLRQREGGSRARPPHLPSRCALPAEEGHRPGALMPAMLHSKEHRRERSLFFRSRYS